MPGARDFGKIDFRKQVIMLLPPKLRSTSLVAWLASLVSPLDTVMSEDWTYMYDQYIKGHLTGQKMVMQAGLNSLFKVTTAPYILVETVRASSSDEYMYNEAELLVTNAYNEAEIPDILFVFNETDGPVGGYDFIVRMPTIYATTENLDRLAIQVDIIKLTGKTYKIITY